MFGAGVINYNKDEMSDSGKRVSFGEGNAIREDSSEKSRPDLISPLALLRVGDWMKKGADKYEAHNWEKGMSFSAYMASMTRHMLKFQAGNKEEDHLSAVIFNAMAMIHHQELGEDEEWDDLPKYIK